jgi:hypothetical protein
MKTNKNGSVRGNSGATLLELTAAIALSAMVAGLIFTAFTNFNHGFFRQLGMADRVQRMLTVKKLIDRSFEDICVVVSREPRRIEYKSCRSNTPRTLRFDSASVWADSAVIVGNLSGFSCALTQEPDDPGRGLLSWEASIGAGWIGGARRVQVER